MPRSESVVPDVLIGAADSWAWIEKLQVPAR